MARKIIALTEHPGFRPTAERLEEPARSARGTDATGIGALALATLATGVEAESGPNGRVAEDVPTGDLYPAPDAPGSLIGTAVRLLEAAKSRLQAALAFRQSADLIAADDEVQQIGPLLDELFCCRRIGDGFGSVVNALHFALENRQGDPLDEKQILELKHVVTVTEREPFMLFERAIELIEGLEDSGLVVSPAALDALADSHVESNP